MLFKQRYCSFDILYVTEKLGTANNIIFYIVLIIKYICTYKLYFINISLAFLANLNKLIADINSNALDIKNIVPDFQHFTVAAAKIQNLSFTAKTKPQSQVHYSFRCGHAD